MDMTYPTSAEEYRSTIQSFLRANLPEGFGGIGTLSEDEVPEFTEKWRSTLYANGLLAPYWPKEYGGAGLSRAEEYLQVFTSALNSSFASHP